jgi:hypothetical protein
MFEYPGWLYVERFGNIFGDPLGGYSVVRISHGLFKRTGRTCSGQADNLLGFDISAELRNSQVFWPEVVAPLCGFVSITLTAIVV